MPRRRSKRTKRTPDHNVPSFTIDLSLPPKERYKALAIEYGEKIHTIMPLFDGLLTDLGIPSKFHLSINRIARMLLRRLQSSVETDELRGVSEVTGVPMYLLVAFNVVLDLLMGCTSGAVKSLELGQPVTEGRMLHFRTLDWSMDPLRSIIVQLDFVRSRSGHPARVIARSITYVGFVGVLTGVRRHLSMSLNFRAVHNATTRGAQFRFYLHHLLVLLGLRQSISSLLRSYLFSEDGNQDDRPGDLATISEDVPPRHTTAAYLIFSNGLETMAMEKDFGSAIIRKSSAFIVATNHDVDEVLSQANAATPASQVTASGGPRLNPALAELIDESKDRMDCISKKWEMELRKAQLNGKKNKNDNREVSEDEVSITEAEVVRWVSAWPTTNECTHFAAVLDPQRGQILWAHSYVDPAQPPK